MRVLEQQQVVVTAPIGLQRRPAAHARPRSGRGPSHRTRASISQLGCPVPGLEDLLDLGQERGGVGAVEGAVVERQREDADGMDRRCRRVAVGQLDDDRPLLTPSVDRMATCGWLMTGEVRNVPNGRRW